MLVLCVRLCLLRLFLSLAVLIMLPLFTLCTHCISFPCKKLSIVHLHSPHVDRWNVVTWGIIWLNSQWGDIPVVSRVIHSHLRHRKQVKV